MEKQGPATSDGSNKKESCSSPLHSSRQDATHRTLATSGDGKLQPLAVIGTAVKLEVKPPPSNESQAAHSRKFLPPIEEDIDVDCLLLADATIECAPVQLRQLLQHFDIGQLTVPELLLLLIYTVALETGYCAQAEYALCREHLSELSASNAYHSRNIMHLTRLSPTYTHDSAKTHFTMQLRSLVNLPAEQPSMLQSQLSALVTGDYMLVTLTPDQTLEASGSSVCLSIGRYVLAGSDSSSRPLYQRFRKLAELAGLLRADLLVPVRNCQLEMLQAAIYPSLLGMPAELYETIFCHLRQNQLNILANVCKHLHYHATNSKYMKAKKRDQ